MKRCKSLPAPPNRNQLEGSLIPLKKPCRIPWVPLRDLKHRIPKKGYPAMWVKIGPSLCRGSTFSILPGGLGRKPGRGAWLRSCDQSPTAPKHKNIPGNSILSAGVLCLLRELGARCVGKNESTPPLGRADHYPFFAGKPKIAPKPTAYTLNPKPQTLT